MADLLLLPHPQRLTRTGGELALEAGRFIALDTTAPGRLLFTAQQLHGALVEHAGLDWPIIGGTAGLESAQIGLRLLIAEVKQPESYRLRITTDGIQIAGADAAGVFYGVQTLIQLLQQHGKTVPTLDIVDWPDLPARGVMLDVTRDKVPTMQTLYDLVDRLAGWKVNQLQLYTEHAFAYRNHPAVWATASPITAAEIMALDSYCRERFIELVPNQTTLGHMHRWFVHDAYLPLAEAPHGSATMWGTHTDHPFGLNPTNPASLTFLEGLFAELLPNFSSKLFNVNCDETFDLGQGYSKALVAERGKGRVYLDFLLEIYKRVKAHGRTMQFWGDIIGEYPDLVPDLPKDAIALEWGYDAAHPFAEKSKLFGDSGIAFYVCPGTSAWCSLSGRTTNMLGNISNALEHGLANGAVGILNTDWGDSGAWQQLPISYPGLAYGAGCGWALTPNRPMNLPAILDAFVFQDRAGVMGQLAYDLGNTYLQQGLKIHNGSILFWAYGIPLQDTAMLAQLKALDNGLRERLYTTLAYIDTVMAPLGQAAMTRPDALQIQREYELTARMLRLGARKLLYALGDPMVSLAQVQQELAAVVADYRLLWLRRNRPGGLDSSVQRMTGQKDMYESVSAPSLRKMILGFLGGQ